MKQIYLVPNIITAFGLACGLFVIFKVNMIEPGSGNFEMVQKAALLLLLAALADFVDGAVARAFKAESEFGIMFDSLADAVSFGVAPSVLLLKTLSLHQGSWLSFLAASGAMVYSLCGILRLVRFNVRSTEAKGHIVDMTLEKKHFTGLPIPAAAAASIALNLFFLSPVFIKWVDLSDIVRAVILSCVMIFIGYLMVSRWKFPSMKGLHFKVRSFNLAFLTVVVAIFVLYGIFYYFPIVLVSVSWGYVIIALIIAIIRKVAGKKSKTLKDFEPDDDDLE